MNSFVTCGQEVILHTHPLFIIMTIILLQITVCATVIYKIALQKMFLHNFLMHKHMYYKTGQTS